MHFVVILPLAYLLTLYLWGLMLYGILAAFFFVATATLLLLSFIVKFKFVFAIGYMVFEIIYFYRPTSQARKFSIACLILFLIHFLLVAVSGFDYVWWSEISFSKVWEKGLFRL